MLKIYIVDDSLSYRSQIEKLLHLFPEVEIVGSSRASTGTLSMIESVKPDLLILELGDGIEGGFELLNTIHQRNIPLTTLGLSLHADLRMKAFSLGCKELIDKGKDDALSSVRLVAEYVQKVLGAPKIEKPDLSRRPRSSLERFEPQVVVIASSTGGPPVLESIFRHLRPSLRIPILIAQHMPELFTKDLAARLSKVSGLNVREAVDGETLLAGTVYVAPGNFHMRLANSGRKVRIILDQGEKLHSVRPAADFLFKSAAAIFGKDCMGFVLTGMGMDGAEGAQTIRDLGGKVMIQDKESSAVWGMPGAAHALGAFDAIGSTDAIGDLLAKMSIGK